MTIFILHLRLTVFDFSAKLSSFALASKERTVLQYSHPCAHFFLENINANLSFVVSRFLFSQSFPIISQGQLEAAVISCYLTVSSCRHCQTKAIMKIKIPFNNTPSTIMKKRIRSAEGLTFETSALGSLFGGQFNFSYQLC